MPAFTFEKITPPVRHSAQVEPKKFESGKPFESSKPRGMIVRMLDRFVASRVKHSLREEQAAMPASKKSIG